MNNYILLITILICSQIGFSQVDVNIDKSISLEEEVDENYTPYEYISNGVYKITIEESDEDLMGDTVDARMQGFESFIKRNNYSYDILILEKQKGSAPYKFFFSFRLKDSLGNTLVTKKEATKEIIKMKKLLDLEVLTKEEFDNKTKSLRAIILK
jgi:hypothetical protein